MTPEYCALTISIDWSHLEGNISEIEIFFRVNFNTRNFDSAIVGVHDCLRILLFNNDSEVIGLSLIPDTMWVEDKSFRVILICQEWWVLLIWHAVDIKFWLIVSFFILKLWKWIFEFLSSC